MTGPNISALKSGLFLGLALWATASAAQVDRPCSADGRPRIDVVSRLGAHQLNITPREQLTLAATVSREGEADGITDFAATADLTLEPSPARGGCPVRSVQVVVQAKRLEVYIAKEVHPSSCRFRAVYEHEMLHVILAQKALDRSAPQIKRQIANVMDTLPIERARTVEDIRVELAEVIREQINAMYGEYVKSNEKLDTPAEAMRLEELCSAPKTFVGGQLVN